jgi:Tfp pilus assembly protein PilF
LLDYWPLGRLNERQKVWQLIFEKIPFVVLALIASTFTFLAQTVTISSLEQLPLLPRVKNAVVSIVIYIGQMFWPVHLAVFYPHPHDFLNPWVVLASTAAIIALTIGAIFIRKRYGYVFVGWFWFLVMLLPVLGIVQAGVQGHADRFTYLPHIGLFIAISWGLSDLTRTLPRRDIVLGTAAAIVLSALTLTSWHQARYWTDSVSLWTHALAVTSNNAMAHQDLAVALWDQGKKEEATWHVQESDIIHWRNAVRDFPHDVGAHDQLGTALARRDDVAAAIAEWQASLQIDPSDGNAANNLAWVLATNPDAGIRDGRKAVGLAERAARLPGGENAMVLRTLAAAYAEDGRFTEASETAERAAQLADAQNNPSLAETLRIEVKSYNGNKPHREPISQ